MKKRFYLFSLVLLLALTASTANANILGGDKALKEKVANMTDDEKRARIEEIKTRVEEIKNMDKSSLSHEEKKELRKELKSMHKEAKAVTGVYISIGALIIIILLLIIIL